MPVRSSRRRPQLPYYRNPGLESLEERALLSHFRAADLKSEHISGNTYEFHSQQSWRRTAFGSPTPGTIIQGVSSLNFGDSTSQVNYSIRVLSVDVANDFFVGEMGTGSTPGDFSEGIVHTYSGSGIRTASIFNCCRVSTLSGGNNDRNFNIAAAVNVGQANSSPVSSINPIVQMNDDAINTFQFPAIDPNGQAITYSLTSNSESGLNSQPPGLTINPSSGVLSWDIRNTQQPSVAPNQLWPVQIRLTDDLGASTSVDFLIQVVPPATVNALPEFDSIPLSALSVPPGGTLTFNVQVSDPDLANTVTLNILNALPGMTLTTGTPLPGSRANALLKTFSWTPTPAQAGVTYVLNFEAQDSLGAKRQASVSISPIANQTPTANAGGSYLVDEGSTITLTGGGNDDGTIVGYEWDLDYDGVTFNSDATGINANFSAALLDGPTSRIVALRVTDNHGAQDIDSATVTVQNVAPRDLAINSVLTVQRNEIVHLQGTFTDPGVADTHTIHWHISDASHTLVGHGHGATYDFQPPAGIGVYHLEYSVVDDDLAETNLVTEIHVVDTIAPQALAINVLFGNQSYDILANAGNRLRLPWKIDAIEVVFSEEVGAGTLIDTATDPVLFQSPTGSGTNKLRWNLTSPAMVDQILLRLNATDLYGNTLDGNGDTVGGDPLEKAVKVLWGDFNDDGTVNTYDATQLRNWIAATYNIFADLDGNGVVNNDDVNIARSRVRTSLL